jgi:hypothetical protein
MLGLVDHFNTARWVHDGCRRERKREKDDGVSHWLKADEHEKHNK